MRILLNGIPYECPTCYEELRTKTYQRVISEWDQSVPLELRDYFHLFSILTNSDFKSVADTAENHVTIWNAIKWFVESPFEPPTDVPKVLVIGEKVVDIPQDLRMMKIGQNIKMKQILEGAKFIEEKISMACAVYLQPAYSGEKNFDFSKVKRINELIGELPIYLTHSIGFFLLRSAAGFGNQRASLWRRILRSLRRKSAQALHSWRRFPGYGLSRI